MLLHITITAVVEHSPWDWPMINQLRLYRIDPDLKDVFLRRFKDHAARIMRERYGFNILAMWLSEKDKQVRFIYLLAWQDAAAMERGWKEFMADEEWAKIKRQTREAIGEPVQAVEDVPLKAVDFSAPLRA